MIVSVMGKGAIATRQVWIAIYFKIFQGSCMTNRNQTLVKRGTVDLAVDTTLKKKQKLRNNEYYGRQETLDKLYAESVKGKTFTDLVRIISSEDNILLAYRNIKNNKGSKTKGTDGRTIEYYKDWSEEKFVKYIQGKLANYQPKSVRRVEIPKDYQPGKTRPLGIPCMDDRIIQQCMLQVLEPICEAKFHKHSYGFRPNRATSHAIARTQFLMWNSGLHYVVDVDVKGFFDNVDHGKLLKQMWNMGIQDKNLLSMIGRILKSEIKGIGKPVKGTPQGGIISPLLSNVVLNELDWWLSNQWETKNTRYKYSNSDGVHRALKRTALKEFYFVRYADDFKILCRDYKTAQKIFAATKDWLSIRLGLEISPEKSKITNVRKGKTEFLGFALYVKKKKKKFVTRSDISEKALRTMQLKLKEQVKVVQRETTPHQVNKLNSMILGMHGYYKTATTCSHGFGDLNYIVNKSLRVRLREKTRKAKVRKKKTKPIVKKSRTFLKLYGEYKGKLRTVAGITIFPISYCSYEAPRFFKQEISKYTESGRKLIHDKLTSTEYLIRYLLDSKEYDKSVEYNDNRISLMAGQSGKCGVTGEFLAAHNMECHHIKPKSIGGSDAYDNLVWIRTELHELIHATQPETINKYLKILKLDKKALKKVNSLRLSAENFEIKTTVI
jgi:group II intron reverse transcriptase/maturase